MTAQTNDLFINRELSWLDFNRRVLDLSKDKGVPIGEQLKFAAIYASNLDEFFMVRVGSLYDRTLLKEPPIDNKTGWTPAQQLAAIMPKVRSLQQHADKCVARLYEKLAACGYEKVCFDKLSKKQDHFWRKYFLREVYPLLSPQVVDRRHPFPFLRNNETYIGVILKEKNAQQWSLGLVPVSSQFTRIVFLPGENGTNFALVEEMICHYAALVFGKGAVHGKCILRITRNADITMDEGGFDQDADYREVMSELLKKRRKLAAVRMQLSEKAPAELREFLCAKLMLPASQCFEQSSPLDFSVGYQLAKRLAQNADPGWFYPPRRPMLPPAGFRLSKAVEHQDVLLSYPYQSMRPFIQMLHYAAHDPHVVSIKMTLYRVAHESKIIEALIAAAENGKEVVVVVELRARFDEQNNIDYSKQLEEAGCTVIYGFEEYKVHSKLTLITRVRDGAMSYISQIGTGNYNEKTSEQYTDLSFITTDPEIGAELAEVFQNLAMERLTSGCKHLLVAPLCFKSVMIREIDGQIEARRMGKEASIVLKCNSVSDKEIIEKLSEASCAGVKVRMIVRGICCLKAGVPGLTENITVRSIVGRYLEHERVYAFGQGDELHMYIASGDFLTRNTERRVEVGVRIRDRRIVAELLEMLDLQLRDNVNASEMQPDGRYVKVKPAEGEAKVDSQLGMYDLLANSWPVVQTQPAKPAQTPKREKRAQKGEKRAAKRAEKPQRHSAARPLARALKKLLRW